MKTRGLYYILFFISFLFVSTIDAQIIAGTKKTPALSFSVGDSILPADPAVRTGRLANGFTYFIRRNTEPLNRATFYLPMKAGSILENENELGLAHFLEHMAFNGTKNFPKNALINYLQTNGVRFGADINAYTSFDETVYQLPLPTDDPEIIKNGLQILRDWAQDILLESEEIEKERGVIIEEKRTRKGASDRMQKQYLPMLLNHSRFVNRLPIGTEEVLLNFKPETIREFYKKWYRPDLQGIVVVGDINVDEMERWVIEKFSDLKNPSSPKERIKYRVPLSGANQFMAVTDKEQTHTVIQVLIKHEASTFKTVADFKASIYKQLFNNMMSARIAELSKQENPPFLQGGSNIGNFMLNIDVASIVAAVKPGELETGFKAVFAETERVKKFGFTQTELDRAKQMLLTYYESLNKEKDKTHSQIFVNKYIKLFLNDEAAPGPDYEYNFYKEHLPKVTLEKVNSLATEYYTEKNRDILILAPENQTDYLPTEETVLHWMSEVASSDLKSYEDGVSGKALMSHIPAPGKIIKEKEIHSLGIKELTLNNGVKVILKPTDFKNDEIRFSSYSPGGNSLYSDEDYQSAVNAPGFVASSGVSEFSPIELPKIIAGKMVSLSPYISERYEGMNGSSSPEDLETAFQLIHLFFTEPRIDSGIVKGLVSNFKSSLTNRGNDPNAVFSDSASAILGNYHPRRTGPTIEKADEISSTRAFEVYKDRFADASDFTFFFVGNINEDSIKPLLETYLGSLPSINRKEKAKDLGIRVPSGQIKKIIYKGTEDKAFVQLVFSGNYKYGLEQNLLMNGLEEILKIRLTERLRETEEGVYSPSASVNYSLQPVPTFSVSIGFSCSPQNVDKLIAATLDEIHQLQKNGPEEKDVKKFISEQQRSRQTQLKTNNYWLNYLSAQYKVNGNLEDVYKY
ncbi:MAG: insulinase family protein, partial [Ginsengibacter sp.]